MYVCMCMYVCVFPNMFHHCLPLLWGIYSSEANVDQGACYNEHCTKAGVYVIFSVFQLLLTLPPQPTQFCGKSESKDLWVLILSYLNYS